MDTNDPDQLQRRCIGVFDSGLGGLTVVRSLSQAMGGEDIVYLGDSARIPYGIKSLQTIRRFAREDTNFLLSFSPKLIVVACNSASAAAYEDLQGSCPVEVVDVIRPGAAAALAATDGPIGVIATEATIFSGAYQAAIAEADRSREVLTASCPLLVPIVEEGRSEDDPIVLSVLTDYLRDLQRARLGALILGCTHYPLLAGAIGKLMGPDVVLVSSADAAAARAREILRESGLASASCSGGKLNCFTTDAPERFANLAARFAGRAVETVQYVGTDELETQPGAIAL